jgi:hypothetical protein
LACCASPAAAQNSDGPQFTLEELRSTSSPEGFLPRGGAFVDDTTSLIWGAGGYLLFRSSGDTRWVTFDGEVDPRGLRIVERFPLATEVLDGKAIRIVRYDADGTIVKVVPLPLSGPINEAVVIDTMWLVHTAVGGGVHHLHVQSPTDAGGWRALHRADEVDIPLFAGVTDFRLSGSSGVVFYNELRSPFRTWQILRHGSRLSFKLLLGPDQYLQDFASAEMDAANVIALPTQSLGSGYLHQLADLSEDRRIVLVSRANEGAARWTIWHLAIGMIASDPATRRLIAFRDVGLKEIVIYRWGWNPDRRSNQIPSGDRQ